MSTKDIFFKRAVQVAGKSKPLYVCYENGRFFKQVKKNSVYIFHAFAVGASSHSNLPWFEQSVKYLFHFPCLEWLCVSCSTTAMIVTVLFGRHYVLD